MPKHGFVCKGTPRPGVIFGICAVLIAITWLVFGQTLGHQFVTYDDPQYVFENANVTAGLSLEGVSWAFTHVVRGSWHPPTVISHMLNPATLLPLCANQCGTRQRRRAGWTYCSKSRQQERET